MKQTVKHILRALLLVAVAAAMGSCVLGRKYQSPELNLPDRLSDSAPRQRFAAVRRHAVVGSIFRHYSPESHIRHARQQQGYAHRGRKGTGTCPTAPDRQRRHASADRRDGLRRTGVGELRRQQSRRQPRIRSQTHAGLGDSTSGAISAGHAAREWRNTSNRWRRSGHCK